MTPVSYAVYQTMDKVQNKPYSSVQYHYNPADLTVRITDTTNFNLNQDLSLWIQFLSVSLCRDVMIAELIPVRVLLRWKMYFYTRLACRYLINYAAIQWFDIQQLCCNISHSHSTHIKDHNIRHILVTIIIWFTSHTTAAFFSLLWWNLLSIIHRNGMCEIHGNLFAFNYFTTNLYCMNYAMYFGNKFSPLMVFICQLVQQTFQTFMGYIPVNSWECGIWIHRC
jgi:hypothetical protein